MSAAAVVISLQDSMLHSGISKPDGMAMGNPANTNTLLFISQIYSAAEHALMESPFHMDSMEFSLWISTWNSPWNP
jgi:hypothetical protein